ncbi:MAG: hypothetical protein EG828_05715 [Deltaproteobacteria bacterium]|nr:hypothetical protein [Deltaproteobacteria bacterium]
MSIHNRSVILYLGSLMSALFLATSLNGCTFHLFKSQEPNVAIDEDFRSYKGGKSHTYFGLQGEVMAFADQYALTVWEAADKLLRSVTDPQKRLAIQYRKILLGSAALRIAAGRNPAANLLDMVVFVTLERMVIKEYWVPEVYGAEAQALLEVHGRLEKEIWSLAGEILNPGQLQELRNLIGEWRAAHPKQFYVLDVRLKELTELRGKYPGETEKEVDSLLGAVEKSLVKVDEALLTAERAMFYFERMPRIVTLQTELLMDQLTTKPEVGQLVGDVTRFTSAFEKMSQTAQSLPGTLSTERSAAITQMTDWLDKEHRRLMADLDAKEPQVKGIVSETRLALSTGNDLVKSVDALYARLQAQKLKDNSPPVDYVKTLEKASDTARRFQELVLMMDAFVAGEEAVKPAALSKALNEINAQSKSVLNHIFLLAAGLIILFFVGLVLSLLGYRYLARRLVDSHRALG